MTCYHPLRAYRSMDPTDKRPSFSLKTGYIDQPIDLPCGHCIGCQKSIKSMWSIRIQHEAQMHEPHNCVVNLTYSPEFLPLKGGLDHDDIQLFIKRLRKIIEPKKIRYFGCGEYGKMRNRPHYHIIIFGYDFPDKYAWSLSKRGTLQYRSPELEKLWKYGHSTVGELNPKTATYVAGYVQKKLENDNKSIEVVDCETGLIYEIPKEYAFMSKKPGIGDPWFKMYYQDILKDYIVLNGHKLSVPRYYREKLKEKNNIIYEKNKRKRRIEAKKYFEKRGFKSRKSSEKYDIETSKKRNKGELNGTI